MIMCSERMIRTTERNWEGPFLLPASYFFPRMNLEVSQLQNQESWVIQYFNPYRSNPTKLKIAM